ncbi:MAG: glycoside hydrolase family 9 protein [Spirochaetota bacterium]
MEPTTLHLNELEYLEMPGLNVMLAHDYYPDGHQGGVSIVQHGRRVATNGDIRLDRAPGQWSPVPRSGSRMVDADREEISVRMEYPDPEKNRTGFNPIDYPDLELAYTIRVRPSAEGFTIRVDLERELPLEWVGVVGFQLELFPGHLFGRSYTMDGVFGTFPRQANGPGEIDADGTYQIEPLARGRSLVIAPESDEQRIRIESASGGLELLDGRGPHNNGWFIVRSLVPGGQADAVVEWSVSPHVIPGWRSAPVVQVSQVGYHPRQPKYAVVELDARDEERHPVELMRIHPDGSREAVLAERLEPWGRFLRFTYLRLDFSSLVEPGLYEVRYGAVVSNPFRIASDIYSRHVWQPTLEYFLPVQMCHMRVNDRSRVWHGACHLDDARMAPTDLNHFDGYVQGPETLCDYAPGDHVPGLDAGGWHDAGDHDLRIESQATTVHGLALAHEAFDVQYDNTTVDQTRRVVEIHRPDGIPDILQQVEHGCLSIVGAYRALGRLYRGIITPTLRQYTILGDPVNQSDGLPFGEGLPGSAPDDRWVFTERNPARELNAAGALAAASRVLRDVNPELASESLAAARAVRDAALSVVERTDAEGGDSSDGAAGAEHDARVARAAIIADVELLLATGEERYREALVERAPVVVESFAQVGWVIGRVLESLGPEVASEVEAAAKRHREEVDELEAETPYGVPYRPNIWGAGWAIQNFGMRQYFLHVAFPDVFPLRFMLHALSFVLGCHPGPNTASFVSGVGADSLTVAYGFNRDDWSYIPGGSASGTALIRPDLPELLEWPHLWQQTEYVLGGGTTDYLILALAADRLLNRE